MLPSRTTPLLILVVLGLALCGYAGSTPAHAGRPTSHEHRPTPTETKRAPAAPPTSARTRPVASPTAGDASNTGGTRACVSARHAGKDVVARDFREGTSVECKLADAEHNRDVSKRWLATAMTAEERAHLEVSVQGWDLVVLGAQIAVMKRDLATVSTADKSALERKIDGAIGKADAQADRLAQRVRGTVAQAKATAQARVRTLQKEYERATGKPKAQAQQAYLGAQRAVQRLEKQLADYDLLQAERKLEAAKARVGHQAQQLRDQAEEQLQQAKQKYEATSAKLRAELDELEKNLHELEKTLGAYEDQGEQMIDDAVDTLEEGTEVLGDAFDF